MGERTRYYAWHEQQGEVAVHVWRGGRFRELVRYTGKPLVTCQRGGLGLFVASRHGLDLFQRDDHTRHAIVGRLPRIPRPPGQEAYPVLGTKFSPWVPNRIQVISYLSQRDRIRRKNSSEGGPVIRFTDDQRPRKSWELLLVLQWNLGREPLKSARRSRHERRLKLPGHHMVRSTRRSRYGEWLKLPGQHMTLTEAACPPVSVYPDRMHRQAAEEVYDALYAVLQ